MHRIYFDTNEGNGKRYALWLSASRSDLASISSELRDGLRVIIYMTDELEMEATLEYDAEQGAWMAIPDDSTIKHYY